MAKKDCPNCNTEIGARSHICKNCAYHFLLKEVRQDLLDKKNAPKPAKYYTSPGAGRKTCPECSSIISAITKICPKCNFDFVALKKEKEAEKSLAVKEEKIIPELKMSSLTKQVLAHVSNFHYDAPIELSSKEQAQRILSYGKDRATALLKTQRNNGGWGHVDWKMVEEELKKL